MVKIVFQVVFQVQLQKYNREAIVKQVVTQDISMTHLFVALNAQAWYIMLQRISV